MKIMRKKSTEGADVEVVIRVKASFVITLGLYAGAITYDMIAEEVMEHVKAQEDAKDIMFINSWEIESIQNDGGLLLENDDDPFDLHNV